MNAPGYSGTIVLIHEVNVHGYQPKHGVSSIWAILGPYDDVGDDTPEYYELDYSRKLVGRIDSRASIQLLQELEQLLLTLGFAVKIVDTADD